MTLRTTWDSSYEATPPDNQAHSQGAQRIREMKQDVRERLEVDHVYGGASDTESGEHKQISFNAPLASAPTNAANKCFVYPKDVSSKVELFFMDEDGNEVQLTSAGTLATIYGAPGAAGNVIVASSDTAAAFVENPLPMNYLAGCGMTIGTDTDHDINFAAGVCRNTGNTANITPAALTKQLDATWASGSAAGGMASGVSLANNTWYHCFAVKIGDAYDFMFDTSLTCANGVSGNSVTHYRRIGSIKTDGSANIVPFLQKGDYFEFVTPRPDYTTTSLSTTSVLFSMSVPTGLRVLGNFMFNFWDTGFPLLYISGGDQTDTALGTTTAANAYWNMAGDNTEPSQTNAGAGANMQIVTDTSGRLRVVADRAISRFNAFTAGYWDTRGKDS